MAKPTINEIIEAIKSASGGDKRRLAKALSGAGISVGSKDSKSPVPGMKEPLKNIGEMLAEIVKPLERTTTGFNALVESSKEYERQNQKFFQAGYTGQMFDFSKSISAANAASLDLNASLTAGNAVTTAFRDGTLAIAVASEGLQKSLMKAGVAMHGAGFDMKDFAEIVDSAAFAFNKNESQIKGLTSTLINVQREIPVSGRELAENFRFAQKNFAYSAGKMMDNFIGLQKMSVTTGVSFGSLSSAFGDSMDTFKGSADKAGKLNQILGKSVFNSMEMLTMTETERATKVRSAIMKSGRSIEDMGKFELLALKDAIGLGSVEETRKFLRGDLKIDKSKQMKALEAKDPTAIKSKKLEDSLTALQRGIEQTRPFADNLKIQFSKIGTAQAKSIVEMNKNFKKLQQFGLTIDQAIPAWVQMAAGATTGKRDRTTTTGLEYKQAQLVETLLDQSNKATTVTKRLALMTAADLASRDKGILALTAVSTAMSTLSAAITGLAGKAPAAATAEQSIPAAFKWILP